MEKVSSLYLANIIIEDNLKTEKDQAMARWLGLMEIYIRGNGKMVKKMEKESITKKQVIVIMMENGNKVKNKEKDC